MKSKSDNPPEFSSSCWQVLSTDGADLDMIRRDIDSIFKNFYYHPEVEWHQFGYLPPDGYDILDAWRNPRKLAFAFLLENPMQKQLSKPSQVILYALGDPTFLNWLEKKINALKKGHSKRAVQVSETLGAAHRLDQMNHNRSLGFFTGYLTFITALVNAFSHYLKSVEPPQFESAFLAHAYLWIINSIHFSSIGLLALVAFVCGIFLIKYSFILLKRM